EESSALDPTTLNNVNGPSYTKRAVESTVLVQDGQLIALGGLLQDSYNDSMEKTPFLGDLPYIGPFFRYETKTHIKTNLMLFLRPYVIRDAEQSDAITQDRYSLTREFHNNYEPNVRILSNETLLQLPPDNGPGSPMVSPLNAPIPATGPPTRGIPQKP
ncbi:MAG: type II secretion system protein GspD, partial [Ferrovum sp.]|nr:type II secretion system protein GspD [Ferrovum sp.]